ncbi:MAG: trigger factor [Sedimentisphaerales bacterium]|nr:trigger factor [Sedimentisphaerales bacterium]
MPKEDEAVSVKNIVTIEDIGPCRKKVCVEILEQAIKEAGDEQYESLRKEAVVPGFRKGRAPRRLLEKRFGKETKEQVKLKLLADASDSAIKDNKLDILGEPEVDFEKIELPDSGPLKFDFEVEVRPDFELSPLEGIKVKKTALQATDEQINEELKQLQKWSGMWIPREDGAVESEDQIIADVVLKAEEVETQKFDDIEIYVRPNGFVGAVGVEKLDEVLSGAKVGDIRETCVEVPKTYFKEEYRGKKVDLEITIKDIKWLKPSPLDESFLTRFDTENESELRQKLRDIVQHRLDQQSRADMKNQIYEYMLNNTQFDLPVDVVADYSETLLKRQYSNLLIQGLSHEQIEERMDQLRTGSEQQAKQQLKVFFIMDKVAEKLDIEVAEEEINGYIAQLAVKQGQRPERMRETMTRDGSLSQFRLQVREDKCISELLKLAEITEVEPPQKPKKSRKRKPAEKKE